MNPQRPSKSQSERFKEAARMHGCDEDETGFEAKLRKIAKAKPAPAKKPKKKRSK